MHYVPLSTTVLDLFLTANTHMINHLCSHTSWSDQVHRGYLEHSDSDSDWRSVPSHHTAKLMRK